MKYTKLLLTSLSILLIASCGSNEEPAKETTFYKKENIATKKLELSIEASGIIEAISSVEIKSKASGEILLLGAEVGDNVKKGAILGQIDQRTPKIYLIKPNRILKLPELDWTMLNRNMKEVWNFTKTAVFQIRHLKIIKNLMHKLNPR